ncbi:MAG: hypothetical protein BMS9Abin19_0179 [Gammaproteobacteria bacterium]|nr:MAG: hypothetical protein BMS9Abin19_0179 [Gammaproteobacteria bacterium]
MQGNPELTTKRHLELHMIVPGICGPLAETRSLKSSLVIDRWIKTLSKSLCLPSQGNTNDVLASIFKLKFKADFPSAALTLMANDMYDPAMFYMHADPVHLRADMDSAVLNSSADLNISDSESAALCNMLDQHFNQDDLNFFLLNKDQWFVSSKDNICMNTTSLIDATGRNINFILPEGKDSARWKQVLTEAQMLMHSHELNVSRENSGLMSINSLWLHGSGELTDLKNDEIINLCSDHDLLKGFARHIKCDHLKVPDSVNEYADYLLSCRHGSVNVLHLTGLEHLVNYTDVIPWLDQQAEILEYWIYPLLKFTNKNNIKVTLYPCNEKKYQFSKYDILKFWRKGKLEKHVNSY